MGGALGRMNLLGNGPNSPLQEGRQRLHRRPVGYDRNSHPPAPESAISLALPGYRATSLSNFGNSPEYPTEIGCYSRYPSVCWVRIPLSQDCSHIYYIGTFRLFFTAKAPIELRYLGPLLLQTSPPLHRPVPISFGLAASKGAGEEPPEVTSRNNRQRYEGSKREGRE